VAKAPHRRISGLSWQIIFFNATALAIMIAGVLLVQSGREGLVDERMAGIRQVASIVTSTLAEYTAREKTRSIDIDEAEPLLQQLIAPTHLRARLYDTEGRLELDTRNLTARMLTYALGRGIESDDRPTVDLITQRLAASGYRFSTLVTEIVNSRAFQMRKEVGGNIASR
jgi:hypothetical protein